jgi:hypothetical protein
MMYLSQLDCCSVLGIDPKTLRHWMRQAQLQFAPHPTDARLKCLTQAQVQQLAAQHARPLPWPTPASLPQASPPVERQVTLTDLATLTQHLAHLQRSLITLQEQVTALMLEVARDWQRLGVLEALVQPLLASAPLPTLVHPVVVEAPATGSPPLGQRLLPAEVRARSRVTPLIEYGAEARSVLVCPREGTLPFAPDSPEWFDWLASLISFCFVGPQGRRERPPRYRARAAHAQLARLSHHPSARLQVLPGHHRSPDPGCPGAGGHHPAGVRERALSRGAASCPHPLLVPHKCNCSGQNSRVKRVSFKNGCTR